MTLDEFHALDPAALWAALSPEQQASIVIPLLTCAFAEVCANDDGTDCSWQDRETAAGIVQSSYSAAWEGIEAAFPAILADDPTALHGFDASMLDADGKARVRGVKGRRTIRQVHPYSETARIGGETVEIGGWKNVAAPGEPEVWEGWTAAQIDAERLRRHPEQALAFRSVLEPATSDGPASLDHPVHIAGLEAA